MSSYSALCICVILEQKFSGDSSVAKWLGTLREQGSNDIMGLWALA